VLNAYALGIGRVRGRIWFLVFFLVANVLPQEVLVYPLYYISKSLHLYDSLISIVIIFTVIQSAFGTYLLSSVYAEFPTELLDAAEVDGAGRWRTLCVGAHRHPARGAVLPHLPAHTDPRDHRGRHQVTGGPPRDEVHRRVLAQATRRLGAAPGAGARRVRRRRRVDRHRDDPTRDAPR
jgi:hypothetical protein